jgi:hypothetical protein
MGERAIRIEADGVRLYAILQDSPAAARLWEALPISATARVARGEVAFDADLASPPETAAPGVQARPGDLLYRRALKTVAILYEPAGTGDAPGTAPASRPESEALLCGRITGDASRLARVAAGARVKLTALGD